MNKTPSKKVGKTKQKSTKTLSVKKGVITSVRRTRPSWVPQTVMQEEELCPECFKVVGDRSRYKLVCMLGKSSDGMTVGELTDQLTLTQPTVTHHLQVLRSVAAVESKKIGREHIYRLKRDAHCFEECHIPY